MTIVALASSGDVPTNRIIPICCLTNQGAKVNTLMQLGLSSDGTFSGELTNSLVGLTSEWTALQSSGSNFQQSN
jgi:hypothetical protein